MKRKLLFIFLLLPSMLVAQSNVLQQVFAVFEQNTLQADFTITVAEKATQPTTIAGSIIMCGEQFKAEVMGMEVAYDGVTIYTYSEDIDELTLSTPLQSELQDINPLLFAKAISESCKTEIKEQNGNYIITMLPLEQGSGVRDFVLNIRKTDLMPLSATMRETDMKTTTITFRNQRFLQQKQNFTLNKPNAYINDLR